MATVELSREELRTIREALRIARTTQVRQASDHLKAGDRYMCQGAMSLWQDYHLLSDRLSAIHID